tara:strand:+ start:5122 stop:6042 length:921 start_codon:yes stop_codon:yes gene_type:complete
MSQNFNSGMEGDPSDDYANSHNFYIEFYSLVSDKSVAFKAWLEDWDDSFTSQWNPEEVYGRMDPIQTFKRTTRTMTLGWKVIASSITEAQENMRRIQLLQKSLYPGYAVTNYTINGETTPIGTLARAPLFRVQFANFIMGAESTAGSIDAKENGLLCALNGLQARPIAEDGYIDGDTNGNGGKRGQLFPKAWTLSTQLSILHEHFLGWDSSGNWIGAANYPYGQDDGTVVASTDTGDTADSSAQQNSDELLETLEGTCPAVDDERAAEASAALGGGTTTTTTSTSTGFTADLAGHGSAEWKAKTGQ